MESLAIPTSRLTSLHIGWTSSRSMRESRQRYSETMLRGARVSRGGMATDCPPWADGWKELLSASVTAGRSHGDHLSETCEASPRYQLTGVHTDVGPAYVSLTSAENCGGSEPPLPIS